MAKTGAERHADWRARHKERVTGLEADTARLAAENERLRRENEILAAALDEADGRAASPGPRCQHPAEAISNGQCTLCTEWL